MAWGEALIELGSDCKIVIIFLPMILYYLALVSPTRFRGTRLLQHHVQYFSSLFFFQVAIKVIDTRKVKDEYVRANLHREAGIMAKLRHPNIIRLYETLKVILATCLHLSQ